MVAFLFVQGVDCRAWMGRMIGRVDVVGDVRGDGVCWLVDSTCAVEVYDGVILKCFSR